ncbi:MAG: response regulator [Candidatus Pacebacteria bacterium]|nr:response regulator [Candidatus Paceibacterota bacterium]
METETKKQVLLLDDEKLLIEIYKEKLDQSGYDVKCFYSGYDALAALRGGYSPDVMLFDITMPDSMSGYEFLEQVQNEKLIPDSIKIALTNQGQDGEIGRVMQLGADAHWLKSQLLPSEIVQGVSDLLAKK